MKWVEVLSEHIMREVGQHLRALPSLSVPTDENNGIQKLLEKLDQVEKTKQQPKLPDSDET